MNTNLKPASVKALKGNLFSMLDDDWMLITAGNSQHFNTMTASWGSFGILWNKPIAICFIRPHRYTYEFIEKNDHFTLSFFTKEYRNILEFCGSHSGKQTDKIAKTGLVPISTEKGNVYFSQSSLVFECKKIYTDEVKADNFIDKDLIKKIYPGADFHKIFIGEITQVMAAENLIIEKGIHFDANDEDTISNF